MDIAEVIGRWLYSVLRLDYNQIIINEHICEPKYI